MNSPTTPIIERARDHDRVAIEALLREADLPADDFAPHLSRFLVARTGPDVIGAIGAEVYGPEALLRSFVVAPAWRRSGLGQRLFTELERQAEEWGVRRWWLLTTTAERFFATRGFAIVARETAPAAIAGTKEFRDLCPSVAVCLTRARQMPSSYRSKNSAATLNRKVT